MGGKVWINNTSGDKLFETYYAQNSAFCDDVDSDSCLDEYKLDGVINDLEIRDARIRLEKILNRQWWRPPVTPWQIQETDPVETPDGHTMLVTVHMDEEYLGDSGWWIFQPTERSTKEVIMHMRWEGGKIRLYQCEPPPYQPQTEEEPSPSPPVATGDESFIASVMTFLFGPGSMASL